MNYFTDVQKKFDNGDKDTEPPFEYRNNISGLRVDKIKNEIQNSIVALTARRKMLHGMIIRDGWKWEEVINPKS